MFRDKRLLFCSQSPQFTHSIAGELQHFILVCGSACLLVNSLKQGWALSIEQYLFKWMICDNCRYWRLKHGLNNCTVSNKDENYLFKRTICNNYRYISNKVSNKDEHWAIPFQMDDVMIVWYVIIIKTIWGEAGWGGVVTVTNAGPTDETKLTNTRPTD